MSKMPPGDSGEMIRKSYKKAKDGGSSPPRITLYKQKKTPKGLEHKSKATA